MMKKNVFQKIGMTVICCLLLCVGAVTAQTYSTTELITSNKTVTIPATAISVTFEAWGAGGAGGYVQQNAIVNLGGGGGGGAYAKTELTYPNIGSSYQVTVGQGGKHVLTKSWGRITDAVSTHGGSSYVTATNSTAKVVEAVGGKTVMNGSRNGALGGAASDCTGDVAFSGGRGANTPANNNLDEWGSAAGGGAAGVNAAGGDATEAEFWNGGERGLGGSGNPMGNGGGNGGEPQYDLLPSGNGKAGSLYGGGGGGAKASWVANNGGAGANGVVRVTIVTSEPEQFVCGTSKVSDGNMAYETVEIDGLCWTRENLQTEVEGSSYFNNDPNNYVRFGRLYTYEAAASVCPAGWALPSQEQLNALYAAGEPAIRSTEEGAWLPQVECTNTTNFSALGAGMYNATSGQYENFLGYTAFWTNSATTGDNADVVELVYSCNEVQSASHNKNNKYSVRCVKVQ